MSVLIKGATLQQVMRVIMHSTEWLSDDVEIVEVPKHGRLIDADKFKKMAKRDCEDCKTPNSDECLMCKEPAIEAIADLQPTVIEAEGDK